MKTLIFTLLCSYSLLVSAEDVKIQWDNDSSADGYALYKGNSSGIYENPIDIGKPVGNTYIIPSLPASTTFFFSLKAYKGISYTQRVELSGFSNEISYKTKDVLSIPVITGEENPLLTSLSIWPVTFNTIYINQANAKTIYVKNPTTSILSITSCGFEGGDVGIFSTDICKYNINPGKQKAIGIVINPIKLGNVATILRVKTNFGDLLFPITAISR